MSYDPHQLAASPIITHHRVDNLDRIKDVFMTHKKPTHKDYKATIREAKPPTEDKRLSAALNTIANASHTTLSAARMFLEAQAIELRSELRVIERLIERCQ